MNRGWQKAAGLRRMASGERLYHVINRIEARELRRTRLVLHMASSAHLAPRSARRGEWHGRGFADLSVEAINPANRTSTSEAKPTTHRGRQASARMPRALDRAQQTTVA